MFGIDAKDAQREYRGCMETKVYKYGSIVNESLLGSCRGNSILDEAGNVSVILLEIRRGLMWVDFNAEFNPNPVFPLSQKFPALISLVAIETCSCI
jgi:hypothetical protein